MATTPSRTLLGVERVVIVCAPDSSLTGAEVQQICAQLVKKAQSVTSLPVVAASATELAAKPGGDRLVLHVALAAGKMTSDRGSLALTVTPYRNDIGFDRGTPVKSEAQLARLAGGLVVQGPVKAFANILGSAPAKLSRPIRSDS